MGRKISVDDLADAVMENLMEYADIASNDVKKAVRKAGNTARKEIEASAPRDTGAYAKSWSVKTTKETSRAVPYTHLRAHETL